MENSQNDNLTADGIAYLESQGIPTDDEDDDDDIHFCKKCKQVFKKLEDYLEHKVKHDKFKVAYNRARGDKRMVLPTLVMKKETAEKPAAASGQDYSREQTEASAKPRRRRKRKSPPVDIQLIAERNTYICTKCDRKFSREATLKWHIQYDHKTEVDSEDEEEEREEQEEQVSRQEEEEEAQDQSFQIRKEPAAKRVKLSSDDERPYKCDVCAMGFKEIAVLKTHMLTHSNVRQFRCSYENCPYAFKTKGSLVRHERRHTGERPYTCEACGRKFAESGALTRHMRSRNPCTAKTDADLPRYGKKWTYVPNIPAVVTQDKSEDSFVSMVPGEMVMVMTEGENGEQILTEAQVVSNNETVSLMEEGEVTESEVGELVATTSLHSFTPTQCRVCREECLEVEALRAHLRLHLADFPFRCGLCHFTSESRGDLRNHMQSKHLRQLKGLDPSILLPPDDSTVTRNSSQPASSSDNMDAQTAVKQLLELPAVSTTEAELTESLSARAISPCPVCNRTFRGSSYLKQHLKSHMGDRPHECPVCRKSFVTKDTLNKHLIVHTDERNYKCGECGKLFKRIGHVREHLKIHNAERPFPCTVCDKSFKTNNALKVHVRTHTDFYPYECRTCHRHFREKGSLQRHLRTHTGERPFRCHRCGRGFAEHGTLNRHLKAKVQCSQHLAYHTVEGGETALELQIQEEGEEEGQEASGGDIPTVLAQFSSVVADTQEYIVADQLAEGGTQTTEYVVLHTDLAADNVQNVEIVTDGNIDPDTILNTVAGADNSFVVVSEAGNHLHFIDSSTGLTVATMPASAEQLPAVTMMEGGEMGSQSVMMMEGEEVGSQSVTMIDGGDLGSQPVTMIEGGGVESQSVTMMGEEEVGAPAVTVHGEDATPVIISQAVADKGDNPSIMMSRLDAAGTITVHSDEGHLALQAEEEVINSDKVDSSLVEAASEVRETITVHTDSGPVQVMAGGEMADAIKQAMMVAEVVDSSAGTKL